MKRFFSLAIALMALVPLHGERVFAASPEAPTSPLVTVGRLTIPRLKITSAIYKGVTDRQFDQGVGYWPGTALPGNTGNLVIGGHRTAAKRPFYDIEKIKIGDLITVSRPGRSFSYRVSRVMVVRPTDVWIVNPTAKATLTLFTCHPRGSTSKRYVVRAVLIK